MRYLETGLPVRMVKQIAAYKYVGAAKNSNFIFSTLEEYMNANDYTTFDPVTLQNYDGLFQSFVIACLLLFFIAKRSWAFGLLSGLIRSVWPRRSRRL